MLRCASSFSQSRYWIIHLDFPFYFVALPPFIQSQYWIIRFILILISRETMLRSVNPPSTCPVSAYFRRSTSWRYLRRTSLSRRLRLVLRHTLRHLARFRPSYARSHAMSNASFCVSYAISYSNDEAFSYAHSTANEPPTTKGTNGAWNCGWNPPRRSHGRAVYSKFNDCSSL